MSSSRERYYLELLQEEVWCRFDSRKPTFKTNISFEELSSDIFSVTKIKISVPHLKRIFGNVKYDRFPSRHHLDILAQYIGFHHWEEFVTYNVQVSQPLSLMSEGSQSTSTDILLPTLEPMPTLPFTFNEKQELLFVLILLLGLMIGLVILNS